MQKPYQRNKYLGWTPRKIFGTVCEGDHRRNLANEPKNKDVIIMHVALHTRNDVDRLYIYISRKEVRKRTWQHWRPRWHFDTMIRSLHWKKTRWRTNNSHQKQYWQHDGQKKDNNQKIKMGRKTTLWPF